MNKKSKILITGSTGMLGSALKEYLSKNKYSNLLSPIRKELDLLDNSKTFKYLEKNKPDYIFNCAALVGGIKYNNDYPVDFLYKNITMQNNLIMSSVKNKVKKFLHIGSSCVYPKFSKQPIKEKYLLSSYLEETNEAYAIAKISGIFLCKAISKQYKMNYISVMPTNLYGKNDNYHGENSHVIPALIKKIHNAKINNKNQIEVWGDGSPKREFLFADDAARGLLLIMKKYNNILPINLGSEEEISIRKLVQMISNIIGYKGKIQFDKSKPNGTLRKKLDNTKILKLGFKKKFNLTKGLKITYDKYLENNI